MNNKTALAKVAQMGAAISTIGPTQETFLPSNKFGVSIPKKQPRKQREFTQHECIEMFGKYDAVYMNFIPQMMTALVLEQVEELIKYCADNRLSEYKKHMREMKKAIAEYKYDLQKSYGKAWISYTTYLDRFRNVVAIDLFKAYCTFTNEAAKQYVGKEHKDIPARVTFIRMLLIFIAKFDENVDKVLSEKLHKPCHREESGQILLITLLCIDIAETFSHRMKATDNMNLCIMMLANRCRAVAKAIIEDEDGES